MLRTILKLIKEKQTRQQLHGMVFKSLEKTFGVFPNNCLRFHLKEDINEGFSSFPFPNSKLPLKRLMGGEERSSGQIPGSPERLSWLALSWQDALLEKGEASGTGVPVDLGEGRAYQTP